MKIIRTREGDEIIFDDEDYDLLFSKLEFRSQSNNKGYLRPVIAGTVIPPHRLIFGHLEKGKCVDHINRNPFDNRRENLRVATIQENSWNSKKRKNSGSKYKGVFVSTRKTSSGKTYTYIIGQIKKGKKKYSRTFSSQIQAAGWYNNMARILFGEFCYKNEVEDEQLEFWKDK